MRTLNLTREELERRLDDVRRRAEAGPHWATSPVSEIYGGTGGKKEEQLVKMRDRQAKTWKAHNARLVEEMEKQLSWGE